MFKNADWGKALSSRLYERWPKDCRGQPEEPAFLCTCASVDLRDELMINMLEAYGIPCLRIYPGNGSFGKLVLGISGHGVEIHVPTSLLEDAQALCRAETEEVPD